MVMDINKEEGDLKEVASELIRDVAPLIQCALSRAGLHQNRVVELLQMMVKLTIEDSSIMMDTFGTRQK